MTLFLSTKYVTSMQCGNAENTKVKTNLCPKDSYHGSGELGKQRRKLLLLFILEYCGKCHATVQRTTGYIVPLRKEKHPPQGWGREKALAWRHKTGTTCGASGKVGCRQADTRDVHGTTHSG